MIKNKKGFTIVEVVIAIVIFSFTVAGLVAIQDFMSKHTVRIKEKTFANQKAIAMMEELRSMVYGGESVDVAFLDDFDDGTAYQTILTTDLSVTDPADALSGNMEYCGGWKYLRKINVAKLPEETFARSVYVRVYKTSCQNPTVVSEKLAETMTILKTIKSSYTSAHVYDLYAIAIENLPTFWKTKSNMKSTIEQIVQNMQNINPGLEIRTHWITRMSYGRDPLYAPYINTVAYTDTQAMANVYFYPGLTKDATGADYTFYDSDLISGRMNVDGILTNPDSYALADSANHAVRYPRELEIYNEYSQQAIAAGLPEPEMSLRMLMEKLHETDKPLKNTLIVNLHGDMIPLPPVRNYSDAAKDPVTYPNYRVVTHPQRMSYGLPDTVVLRVYPYTTNTTSCAATPSTELDYSTIVIEGVQLTSTQISNMTVKKIRGNPSAAYAMDTVTGNSAYYTVDTTTIPGSTIILLKNTPICNGLITDDGGLPSSSKLYGLEYVPCPLSGEFTRNLTNTDNTGPKNTARWIISFAPNTFSTSTVTFTTRLGDASAIAATDKPLNLSKTYVWVNTTLPVTEQYQLTGDPRHNPYYDQKTANNYNWYHNALWGWAGYGFTKSQNGWSLDFVDADIPKFFEIYREGLMNSSAIWSTMYANGYYYYGLGGEFGSNGDSFTNGLPFIVTPWSTTGSTASANVDEMVAPYGTVTQSYQRFAAKTNKSWYAKYLIGELFPDSEYTLNWSVRGNLPTGAGNYYRANYTDAAFTSDWNNRARQVRLREEGASSFLNSVNTSGNGPFRHTPLTSHTASVTPLGMELSAQFAFALPSDITNTDPWRLDEKKEYPPEWTDAYYISTRTVAEIPFIGGVRRSYYDSNWNHPFHNSSGVVKLSNTAGTKRAYFVVSGINSQADFTDTDMGKYVIASMLRTFFDGGLYSSSADRIIQLPRVNITNPDITIEVPTGTPSIDVEWALEWRRWDGLRYTLEYPATYADAALAQADLTYHMKYSGDNGLTWKFCSTNTLTSAGARSTNPADVYDEASISFPLTWNLSTGTFPAGIYLLRVEAFRKSIAGHYAYDQQRIFIK